MTIYMRVIGNSYDHTLVKIKEAKCSKMASVVPITVIVTVEWAFGLCCAPALRSPFAFALQIPDALAQQPTTDVRTP